MRESARLTESIGCFDTEIVTGIRSTTRSWS